MDLLPILHQHSPSSASSERMRILALRQDTQASSSIGWPRKSPWEMRVRRAGQEMVRVAVTITPGLSHHETGVDSCIRGPHSSPARNCRHPDWEICRRPGPHNVVTVHLNVPDQSDGCATHLTSLSRTQAVASVASPLDQMPCTALRWPPVLSSTGRCWRRCRPPSRQPMHGCLRRRVSCTPVALFGVRPGSSWGYAKMSAA